MFSMRSKQNFLHSIAEREWISLPLLLGRTVQSAIDKLTNSLLQPI